MSDNAFIPEGYEAPASGGGFTKLDPGTTRFRVLTPAFPIWTVWDDSNNVTRIPYNRDVKPAKPDGGTVKHALVLGVYNYKTDTVEVFELDKVAIQKALVSHAQSPDWGNPKNYDIEITKEGSGMETSYSFSAIPPKPASAEVLEAFTETPMNLANILTDQPIFLSNAGTSANTEQSQSPQKQVTPDNWVAGDPLPKGYKLSATGVLMPDKPF